MHTSRPHAYLTALPDAARGLRAALVTVVPFYLAARWSSPALAWMATGGWLGTLADPGGARRTRAAVLFTYGVLAGLGVALSKQAAELPWVAPFVLAIAVYFTSMLRGIGSTAGTVGTLVAAAFAIGQSQDSGNPLQNGLSFAAGVGLALLASTVLLPIGAHAPLRQLVARVHIALADYADNLAELDDDNAAPEAWAELAEKTPRRVRAELEAAHAMALALRARRRGESARGSALRTLLGLAETQFARLIAVHDAAEAGLTDAAFRQQLREVARLHRSVSVSLFGVGPRRVSVPGEPAPEQDLLRDAKVCVRLAIELERGALAPLPELPVAVDPKLWRSLLDALRPRSGFHGHALRAAAAAAIASIVARLLLPEHSSWVVITALSVLQPYPGTTFQRVAERIAGTVLGSGVAVLITSFVHDTLLRTALLIPLSVAAVTTKPRSYRLFSFFLTPVFVLLAETESGGWQAPVARVEATLLGGVVALAISVTLLPSWERSRLSDSLEQARAELQAYARLLFESALPVSPASVVEARQRVGRVLEEAETSLERAIAEPGKRTREAARALELITYGRRLALSLTAMSTWTDVAPRLRHYLAHATREALASEPRWDETALSTAALPAEPQLRHQVASVMRYAQLFANARQQRDSRAT